MRSEEEVREKLRQIEDIIDRKKAENKRVGGGQYTIASVLRWVLGEKEMW